MYIHSRRRPVGISAKFVTLLVSSVMGKRGPKPKQAETPARQKPKGKDTKRTPTSHFDTAAGQDQDVYEPEKERG